MEGRTDLYRLHNGTLTAIRYLDEILGPIVRPYTGTVGPGFLLVHDNAQPHVARVCRQFLEDEELDQQNVKKASVVFAIFNKFGNTLVFPEGEGTFQVTVSLLHHIGKLASDPQVNILIQKEAVRKLNMILGMIPIELKKEKKILSSQETSSVMSDLASRIIKGGDYDLQVALMEALCRMTSRTQRRDLADQLFRMEFVASAFTKIQDSEFETDCRKFLNLVNGMQGDDRSVYSYPCLEVFLDKHVLLMPVDENLHEFWIDFNLGSQSISFYFCLADDEAKESQWDTLCITENEVHSYTVQEEKDIKVLQLVLTEPVCLSSIEGSRLLIHFSSSLDILKATKKVYGETKNKKFIGKTTTSVVKTTVQIILDEGGSQVRNLASWFFFLRVRCSSQHVGKNVPYSVRNDTHCRLLPSEERDAHHINQQIITPLRSKVSESCMYVSGSAGHKLGRSPFSCVLPESASGKAKLKPALEMVPSSEKRKALELKELLTAKLSDGVKSVSVEKESTAKQAVPDLQSPYILPGREGSQVVGKYRRNIPIEKVVEMMQAEQEFQEEPLDNSIVLDSQPAVWKETSILPSSSGFYKKRTSVSGSLFPGQRESSHQSRSEPPQRSLSAQSSSEGLSHKQLHAQLTQRLELVLREREQQEQNPQELLTAGKEAGLVKKAQSLPQTKLAPTEQSGWAKGNGAGMSNTTKTKKAAESMVKQINSHYNHTTTAAQERPSWFNSAPSSRYIFNKSWCPNSVAKISANQSKKASNQNKDIYALSFNLPEVSEKKNRSSFEISGMERSARSSSLSLSSTSKKCPPMKPAGHNVKKHLFSDTDTDNMTDISWLTSANRKPKPNVADYTRQPVKPTRPPTTFTFETPNISIPSPKSAKALPKPKRKRQKKVEEEKNKTTKNLASRKPTDRPKRTSVLTRSYRELSESETVEKSTTMLRSALAPVGPTSKKSQAIVQEGKTGGIIEQAEKEKETPGITTTHPVTSGKFMEENDVSEILGSERLKRIGRRKFLSPVSTKESWASKSTSFRLSPFSIEKMRSAEKNASVPRSPLTPLQPLCISPAGAISPPLDLPSHLRAIQASSFYKSSGGQDIVKTLPHPFVTPAAQRQSAQEKTPASVQGTSGEKAESGPATSRTRHSSCDSTSLSEQDGSEYDKRIKAGPSQHAVRMKPRKLFKPTVKQQSKIKGSKKPLQDDSSTEEGEKEKRSGNGRGPRRRTVTEDMDVRSTVVSSCWKANVEGDMALVQSEVSTSQEMSYVCRQLSSELKRKFENRSRKMDLFTKQSLKTCRQHVSTVTVKVQEYRSQRLEAVKRVLMDEIKNLEQDDTSLRDMEAELTAYWKKHTLDFHAYQERGTERLNHLRSTIETNLCRNTDYEEQIFFSQMHLMKKDMKSVQDHLFRQMHEEEFQSVRKGLQTLFLSDVPMFLR
ncbi:hypothetical protein QTP86_021185 [Hemibagrus guttatus]|nr:hypothetical protein QTP86_021185 [Hemibagrus guttatus]